MIDVNAAVVRSRGGDRMGHAASATAWCVPPVYARFRNKPEGPGKAGIRAGERKHGDGPSRFSCCRSDALLGRRASDWDATRTRAGILIDPPDVSSVAMSR